MAASSASELTGSQLNLSPKNVIIVGNYGSMDYFLAMELLKNGVEKLGILGEGDNCHVEKILKQKYPKCSIGYAKVDNFLTRSTINSAIDSLKAQLKIQFIDVFIINAIKLKEEKIQQIQHNGFFVAVNLTIVAVKLLEEHKRGDETGDPGILAMTVPVESFAINSGFPTYNAKKHALSGYMIALKEEYDDKSLHVNFLAICYKDANTGDPANPSTSTTAGFSPAKKAKIIETQSDDPSGPQPGPSQMPQSVPTPPPTEISTTDYPWADETVGHATDVDVIMKVIRQKLPTYVLHTVHKGEMQPLHFAKYSP